MLYSIVAVLVLVLDQAVKFYTVRNIPPQAIGDACKTLIPGVIHMTNVQNYGAAFSILENAQTVLIIVSVVFIIGIIILINMDIIHTKFGRWTAVLVMAGALGNCIDRVLLGYVVDMFEFELFNFAVFNIADIFITVCGILFCVHVIIYREPEEERNAVPRPEKKRLTLFPSRQKSEEDAYDEEDVEEAPAPRRSAKNARGSRQERAARVKAVREAPVPHRDRSAHRTLEEDLRPVDPDDPFAEWGDGDRAPQPRRAARTEAEEPAVPAPRKARRSSAQKPAAAEARPTARRRTAPTVEDVEDDYEPDTPAPRKARRSGAQKPAAAETRPAARRRTAPTVEDVEVDYEPDMPAPRKPVRAEEPAAPAQPAAQEPEDAGFDEYSLDDILAEFRDT